ncbi:BspA family leucine-rich repeat surface protein, partial [Bombilactobacillus mellifer]|uniref:BspA family leucine-rich repeat surface protein n=1 Tax=Bombilactobacillus mellifer TaxID=1218492 RepID=UPI0023F3949F
MKPRYIKIFIGLLLFYIGFLVINLQIVGQAAVPAANKTMIGMQPRDTSEEKPEDLKYTITEKPLTGTTLEISGGQTINSPILDPGKKPTWPWYDKQGNPIKQLQDIKTIEVKKPLTIMGDMSEIFARMPKLENIVLDKGASVDTTGVTSFYRVFYQDSAIKSVDLSKIQGLSLDSAKNLSRVFEGDKSLESVTLSKNVDQVKDFSGLFNDCSSLT